MQALIQWIANSIPGKLVWISIMGKSIWGPATPLEVLSTPRSFFFEANSIVGALPFQEIKEGLCTRKVSQTIPDESSQVPWHYTTLQRVIVAELIAKNPAAPTS